MHQLAFMWDVEKGTEKCLCVFVYIAQPFVWQLAWHWNWYISAGNISHDRIVYFLDLEAGLVTGDFFF